MSEVSPSPSSGSKVGLIVAIGGLIVAAWMIADHRERSRVTICKRSPEMAMAYDIESAVINFQTEYGRLPEGPERLATDSPEGIRLLEVLSGKETGAVRENSRSIKFLNVREETRGKGGIRHSNDSKRIMGVFDRWGKPLIVLLNRGIPMNSNSSTASAPFTSRNVRWPSSRQARTGKSGVPMMSPPGETCRPLFLHDGLR